MGRKWTKEEDAFLLEHHSIGADYVAPHDLGRANDTRAANP